MNITQNKYIKVKRYAVLAGNYRSQ